MQLTLTAKVKLIPTLEQQTLLLTTVRVIKQALNHTSRFSHNHEVFSPIALHNRLYRTLRTTFGLRSQMAQSVFKTVVAKYKSMKSNQVSGKLAVFKKPGIRFGLQSGLLFEERIPVPQYPRWSCQGSFRIEGNGAFLRWRLRYG